MLLTKSKLTEVLQAARCCHAGLVLKYSKALKYGLDTKCKREMAMLVEFYIDILEEALCQESGCTCSLIGRWVTFDDPTLGDAVVTFINDTQVIIEDELGTSEGTYEMSENETFLQIVTPNHILNLTPINGYNFFTDDCISFQGQTTDTSLAVCYNLEIPYNWDQFDVFYEGVSIYHSNSIIDFSDANNPTEQAKILTFIEAFNTFNTIGAFMYLGENYNDLIIQAPSLSNTWNGTEITIGKIPPGDLFGPNPFQDGKLPTALIMTITTPTLCSNPLPPEGGVYYGQELITNGSFESNLDSWNLLPSTNWEWDSGQQASYVGSDEGGKMFQSILEPGKKYRLAFTYSKDSNNACGPTSSYLKVFFGNHTLTYNADTASDISVVTEYTVASGNRITFFAVDQCSPTGTVHVKDVSVREVITVEPTVTSNVEPSLDCVSTDDLKNIINHLNSICSFYKCC